MTCFEARKCISPYLDSELDPTKTFEVSQHLECCASCRTRFDLEHRADVIIRERLRQFEPFVDWAALAVKQPVGFARVLRFWPRWTLALAACVAFLVIIGQWPLRISKAGNPAQWALGELHRLSPACDPFVPSAECRPQLDPVTEEVMNCRVDLQRCGDPLDLIDVHARTCRRTGKCRVEARLNCCHKPVLLTIAQQDCLGELCGVRDELDRKQSDRLLDTRMYQGVEYHIVARRIGDKIVIAVSPHDVEPLVASIRLVGG